MQFFKLHITASGLDSKRAILLFLDSCLYRQILFEVYFGHHCTAVNLPSRQIRGLGIKAAERGFGARGRLPLPSASQAKATRQNISTLNH
jgi:hypothetical protein